MTTEQTSTTATRRLRTGMGMGAAFLIGVATFAAVFAILRYFNLGNTYEPLTPLTQRTAGALEMPVLSGAGDTTSVDWSLHDQAGKVVVVNYFATWCGPCMEELPDLIAVAKEFGPRGVVVVAVSLDQDNEREKDTPRETVLRAFAKDKALPFPILVPPADSILWKSSMPIPQTYLYDRQGRRARTILGGFDTKNLRASLEELLKES